MAANRVLSDAERDALARFIRSAIDAERYLLSPRLAPLKAILAKLDPKPQVQPVFAAEAWNAEPGDGQEAALGYECCSTTRHEMPRADLGIPISLVWLGRGLPCARMVQIDRRKCLPKPLAFFPDCAILGGLGCSVQPALDGADLKGPPIGECAPGTKDYAVVHDKGGK